MYKIGDETGMDTHSKDVHKYSEGRLQCNSM